MMQESGEAFARYAKSIEGVPCDIRPIDDPRAWDLGKFKFPEAEPK